MRKLVTVFAAVSGFVCWAAGDADPSYRIEVARGGTLVPCRAVRVETGKSDRCFAITAGRCLAGEGEPGGKASVRSAEFGPQSVEYRVTPESIALFHWACPRRDPTAPTFFLTWDRKLAEGSKVEFGTAPAAPGAPRLLATGTVGKGDDRRRQVAGKDHRFGAEDLGTPLLCMEKQESDLCGILVSEKDSRFAVGEALQAVRGEMRKLGVKEWKTVVVDGHRTVRVEED